MDFYANKGYNIYIFRILNRFAVKNILRGTFVNA